MAVTIVRTPWIDDDGSGTTGTVINNAWKTEMYNQIDGALAQLLPLAGGTLSGPLSVNGQFSTSGGAPSFGGSVNSTYTIAIRNTLSGNAAGSAITMGNGSDNTQIVIANYCAAFGSSAPNYAGGTIYYHQGPGGQTFYNATTGAIFEFWTNGSKRWTIDAAGNLSTGGTGAGAQFTFIQNGAVLIGQPGTATTNLMLFYNASGTVGSIFTSGSTTTFNTTSDARLKQDRGIVRSTDVLERTVVHDFDWIVDGKTGRGVFAQEAATVLPVAVTVGTDDIDDGRLAKPWQTDYSKYVPDLIVGWQQHAAELAALRAELTALKGE